MTRSAAVIAASILFAAMEAAANWWIEVTPASTAPAGRMYHAAVWAPGADGIYVSAGKDRRLMDDLHFYDRTREEHTAVWAPEADGFYVFGGQSNGYRNELHFYDRQVNQWTEVTAAGTAPAGRMYHAAVWAPGADGFYVFAGKDRRLMDDLHFYDRKANQWSDVTPAGTAPGSREGHTAVWAPEAWGRRFLRLWWAKRWLQERAPFLWPAVHNVNCNAQDNDLHDNDQNVEDDDHWDHHLQDNDCWDSKESDFQLLVPRACCCFFARSSAWSSFRPGWRHSLRSRGASGNHCLALRKQHLCPLDASRTFIYFTISCRFIQAMLKACQDHMKSSVDPLRNCWEKCCGGLYLHRASAKRIEMNPETGIGDQELHMAHGCTKITSLLMRLPPNLQASSLATDVCIGLFDLSLCMCEHKKSSVPWKVSQAIRFHELLGFCDF